MNLEEAVALLSNCTRSELRDHAFGDREVSWWSGGQLVGDGYYSGTCAEATVGVGDQATTFKDAEARTLLARGRVSRIYRNDFAGPVQYREGATMPGLTLEGVRKELFGAGPED